MGELVLRTGAGLCVVMAVMWGLFRLARRGPGGRTGSVVTLLARQPLGRNSAVAVLRVADRALVLGVTDHHVTVLAEAEAGQMAALAQPRRRVAPPMPGTVDDGPLAGSALSPRTWARAVEALRDRTARRS